MHCNPLFYKARARLHHYRSLRRTTPAPSAATKHALVPTRTPRQATRRSPPGLAASTSTSIRPTCCMRTAAWPPNGVTVGRTPAECDPSTEPNAHVTAALAATPNRTTVTRRSFPGQASNQCRLASKPSFE